MKIIFAGTPPFAVASLQYLQRAGHEIVLVMTQPDRSAGRGMQVTTAAVKNAAQELNLPLYQPVSLKSAESWQEIRAQQADLMVVAAYGLILPEALLAIPRFGCINVHASLLPRWRGAAPIQRAILAGDRETGVCIMQMSAGLDEGDVLARKAIAIAPAISSGDLTAQLSQLGAELLVDSLAKWPLAAQSQDESLACYAKKINKSEAIINWHDDEDFILRQIRAYNPYPGVQCSLQLGEQTEAIACKIWQAELVNLPISQDATQPGKIIKLDKNGVIVQCTNQQILIKQLQRANSKKLSASDFFAGLHCDIDRCYFV